MPIEALGRENSKSFLYSAFLEFKGNVASNVVELKKKHYRKNFGEGTKKSLSCFEKSS